MVDQFSAREESIVYCTLGGANDVIVRRTKPVDGWSEPSLILSSHPAVDGNHVCDPSIVRGIFPDWLGRNWNSLMYYTTDNPSIPGMDGKINVAGSMDSVNWLQIGNIVPRLDVTT